MVCGRENNEVLKYIRNELAAEPNWPPTPANELSVYDIMIKTSKGLKPTHLKVTDLLEEADWNELKEDAPRKPFNATYSGFTKISSSVAAKLHARLPQGRVAAGVDVQAGKEYKITIKDVSSSGLKKISILKQKLIDLPVTEKKAQALESSKRRSHIYIVTKTIYTGDLRFEQETNTDVNVSGEGAAPTGTPVDAGAEVSASKSVANSIGTVFADHHDPFAIAFSYMKFELLRVSSNPMMYKLCNPEGYRSEVTRGETDSNELIDEETGVILIDK